MLNRRHIRIKVMQSIFALFQSKSDNLDREEKFLYFSIDKLYDLFVLQLSLLIETQKFAKKRFDISKQNRIDSLLFKNGHENFINNKLVNSLTSSASLSDYLSLKKIDNWNDATEYIQIVWVEIIESDLFKNYDSIAKPTFKQDKQFIIDVFKEIIAPNSKLFEYYESEHIGWVDDIPFVNTAMVKTLLRFNEKSNFILDDLYKDEDDKAFVKELFRKTVLHHTEYDKIIDEKTPNWDYDRIAGIDLILIKMALSEFIYFPSIPVRVTINEYIEISKDYSSEKSSYFINGVLDKLLKEYQKEDKINKIGRGLL